MSVREDIHTDLPPRNGPVGPHPGTKRRGRARVFKLTERPDSRWLGLSWALRCFHSLPPTSSPPVPHTYDHMFGAILPQNLCVPAEGNPCA